VNGEHSHVNVRVQEERADTFQRRKVRSLMPLGTHCMPRLFTSFPLEKLVPLCSIRQCSFMNCISSVLSPVFPPSLQTGQQCNQKD
jgi:hypothetical protein